LEGDPKRPRDTTGVRSPSSSWDSVRIIPRSSRVGRTTTACSKAFNCMKADYCAYPPCVAVDVEITENRDGDRLAYIVGSPPSSNRLRLMVLGHRPLVIGRGRRTKEPCTKEYMAIRDQRSLWSLVRRQKRRTRDQRPKPRESGPIIQRPLQRWRRMSPRARRNLPRPAASSNGRASSPIKASSHAPNWKPLRRVRPHSPLN